MFITRDKEAGNKIDEFATMADALRAIKTYEEEDRRDGTYAEDFYEAVEVPTSILIRGMEIELTEDGDYRPNTLIINGEFCSREAFGEAHGYTWKTTPSGNELFYRSETGKEYQVPQGRLQNRFCDELRIKIRSTGLSQRAFGELLGIPKRTIEEWLSGNRTPKKLMQELVLNFETPQK